MIFLLKLEISVQETDIYIHISQLRSNLRFGNFIAKVDNLFYHQIQLAEHCSKVTVIITPWGCISVSSCGSVVVQLRAKFSSF